VPWDEGRTNPEAQESQHFKMSISHQMCHLDARIVDSSLSALSHLPPQNPSPPSTIKEVLAVREPPQGPLPGILPK
jgi:hypothetical protein